jgi:hypothetical protein
MQVPDLLMKFSFADALGVGLDLVHGAIVFSQFLAFSVVYQPEDVIWER